MKTSEKIDPDNNLSSSGVHGSNRIICYAKKKYQTHKNMIKNLIPGTRSQEYTCVQLNINLTWKYVRNLRTYLMLWILWV